MTTIREYRVVMHPALEPIGSRNPDTARRWARMGRPVETRTVTTTEWETWDE